jgi:hypothetical protein
VEDNCGDIAVKRNGRLAASTRGLCGQLLARSDFDALVGTSGADSGSTHAVLDLLGHGHEGLLNIGGTLGRGLQEGNGQLVSEFLVVKGRSMVRFFLVLSCILNRYAWHGPSNKRNTHLGDSVLDHLFVSQVRLVADKKLVDTLRGIAVNLSEPLFNVGEGVLVGNIVDDDDAVCAAVVRRSDGAEALLSSSIPLSR